MRLLDDMFILVSVTDRQAVLRLNGAHPIYAVHFPGQPITPGVCLVQLLGELLQRQTGRALELGRIVNLKFVHTLSPDTVSLLTVDFTSVVDNASERCNPASDTACGTVHAKGTITANSEVAVKFSVVYKYINS